MALLTGLVFALHFQDEEPFVDTFRKSVNKTRGYNFKNYWDLHEWSCKKPEEFWSDVGENGRQREPASAV